MATELNEKLSEAVRRFPVLYDKSCKDFKDQLKKNNAWGDVAREIGAESANDAKTMFANLRNRYSREKRKMKQARVSGTGYDDVEDDKDKLDDLYSYLTWLDDYYKPRKTLTNIQPCEVEKIESGDEDATSQTSQLSQKEETNPEAASPNSTVQCKDTKMSAPSRSSVQHNTLTKKSVGKSKKRAQDDIAAEELMVLKAIGEKLSNSTPKQQPLPQPKTSEDQLFCDILASQLERIPYERRLVTRMQISNLVYKEIMATTAAPPAHYIPEQASSPFFSQPYPHESHLN